MFIRVSKGDAVFDIFNTGLLILFLLVAAYPLYFVVIASVSAPEFVSRGEIILFPKGFSLGSYQLVFQDNRVLTGYRNTILYTLFGTFLSVAITVGAAFALSRKELIGRKFFMGLFLLTMYFKGGLIPTYLVVKSLNLINNPLVLILVGALNVFNLIICRSFFDNNIPCELWEASCIDGCSLWGFFWRIALPISKTIIAIMVLYYAVSNWNEYFGAMLYLSKKEYFPLQLFLREILIQNQNLATDIDPSMLNVLQERAEAIKYAVIVVASAPVLALYPFVQKYFVKGVTVGSIKG